MIAFAFAALLLSQSSQSPLGSIPYVVRLCDTHDGTKRVVLTADRRIEARRLVFDDCVIVTNGFNLEIVAETIYTIGRSRIVSFEEFTAPQGQPGRSAGKITIDFDRSLGTIEIINQGQNGGAGIDGSRGEAGAKGTPGTPADTRGALLPCRPGTDGGAGNAGAEGGAGGNGGDGGAGGDVVFLHVTPKVRALAVLKAFVVTTTSGGTGGEGGRGGEGGPGGPGGEGGAGMGACAGGAPGSAGVEGPRGRDGQRGANGKNGNVQMSEEP